VTRVREYKPADFEAIKRIHASSGLPETCLPDLTNPLFFVKVVADDQGKVTQAGFVKLTGEAYILVDHSHGLAQERWSVAQSVVNHGLAAAAKKGLSDVSCWLPPMLERSFGDRRLRELGFIKSPWPCYTALLE
jgi:hypothetical protein